MVDAKPLPGKSQIRALYPDISPEDFKAKLAGVTNSFFFLRTFVPLYYKLMKDFPAPEFEAVGLDKISALCVGDAHPENFGVLLSDAGAPIFTVNDIDDGGPCPAVMDMLRFLVAVHLYDPNQNLSDLVDSYQSSLNGNQVQFSNVVAQMLMDAKGKLGPSGKIQAGPKIERRKGMDDVEDSERKAIQEVVTQVYGVNARVLDAVTLKKASGGSGGMLRFRTLVALKTGLIQLIEFKEIQQPGIFPVATAPLGDPAVRLTSLIAMEQGDNASKLYSVNFLQGRQMLLRPRRIGNLGVQLDDIKSSDLPNVFSDEISVLGRIHARGVRDLGAYRQGFAKITLQQWVQITERYSQMMESIYKDVR